MKILMVLTSHDRLGDTGKKTGFWVEEFAVPCYVFRDAGADIASAPRNTRSDALYRYPVPASAAKRLGSPSQTMRARSST
jgi:putative intracellular protease/amidase